MCTQGVPGEGVYGCLPQNHATQAGTTTGSIYTRFKDKEGLFEAIVGSHYDHIMSRFCQVQEEFAALPAEQQPEE